MNKSNINRKNAQKTFTWCKREYGKSKFKKKFPKFYFYESPLEDKDRGEYFDETNTIHIYGNTHDSFIDFIRTTIHEYTHYLQDSKMYERYYRKHKKSYNSHPYEIRADEIGERDGRKCLHDVFLKKK